MRLRAGLGLLCLAFACGGLAGCQHLPDGVKVDVQNRVVEVGPCRCRLPAAGETKPAAPDAPADPESSPAVGDEPR